MPFCALIGQNYDLNTRFSSKFAPVFEMFWNNFRGCEAQECRAAGWDFMGSPPGRQGKACRSPKFVTALDINCMRPPVYTLNGLCRNPHFPHSYPQEWWVKPRFYRVFSGFSTSWPDLYIIYPQTTVCIGHISTQFSAYLWLFAHFGFDFTSYLPFLIPSAPSLTLS